MNILAVWSRDLDGVDSIGRVNVARQVRSALQDSGTVRSVRLLNCFEMRTRLRAVSTTMAAVIQGLLTFRPLPLQCSLFAASASSDDLIADAMNADVVYADGIRTLVLLRHLRRRAPRLRIVVDLDDLMSRRYAHLIASGLPLSLGYLERSLPPPLLRLLRAPLVAKIVLGYERAALARAEREILTLADVVVLLNEREAFVLREAGAQSGRAVRARVVAIPPAAAPGALMPASASAPQTSIVWRAVFVGSDALVQNRLTISYLVELWKRSGISIPLFIYGRQRSSWPAIPNVVFCGYVEDLAEAYAPGSILVCPAFLPGGIKTKALEGFAYRTPVIGNEASFEGLSLRDYPLIIEDEEDLVELLSDPSLRHGELARAVDVAFDYVVQEHSKRRFDARWRETILGRMASRDLLTPPPVKAAVQAAVPEVPSPAHKVALSE